MKLNKINYNQQSFISRPQKVFQSLAWVALGILALPTVIGSYLALKKAVGVWNKNEKIDTRKTDDFVSIRLKPAEKNNLLSVNADQNLGNDAIFISEAFPAITPLEEKKELYEAAILQFNTSGCLSTRSIEAYCDYLQSTEHGFYFSTDLLYCIDPTSDPFLKRIKTKIDKAKQENASLVFVPFGLAGNMFREEHVVVAVINTAKQQIEYFDAKGNRFYSVFGSLMDRRLSQSNILTQDFLENLSRYTFPDKKPSIIRSLNGPQLVTNKVDCAVHALDFIQTRLYTDFRQSDKAGYFDTSLSSDAKQLRKEMAGTLQARLAAMGDSDFFNGPFARA